MQQTHIVAACRTPIGAFGGTLSELPAHRLGEAVIRGLLVRAPTVTADQIEDVLLGQVLAAGGGQNPARQAAIAAGLPQQVPAMTINQLCGSGLRAVALGDQAIRAGDAEVIVAGGQENMSLAPHLLSSLRTGKRLGDTPLQDSMLCDGLVDAFHHCHMGITAENIADEFGIARSAQDAFAARSQERTAAAQQRGDFDDEIVAVEIPQRKGDPLRFDKDEYPRPQSTAEALAKLRPAFRKEGSVTAGNASGINDGAAAVLLLSAGRAKALGVSSLAVIRAFASVGVDPRIMGTGPIPAVRLCLQRAGWQAQDVELIEANEAFAVQALACAQELQWDMDKVNIGGGAIALGHPIGASGARVLVSLIHAMQRRQVTRGIATLCVGGGQGVAMAIERSAA